MKVKAIVIRLSERDYNVNTLTPWPVGSYKFRQASNQNHQISHTHTCALASWLLEKYIAGNFVSAIPSIAPVSERHLLSLSNYISIGRLQTKTLLICTGLVGLFSVENILA